jgi:NAD(P)-dependent dehydrogenase (short-subunit alcohol dehydrogenase family)
MWPADRVRTVGCMADKTAIITGGSRGLGLALARSLVGDGWHLVIDARNRDELDRARRELAAVGSVRAVAGDVTDAAHREALVAAAVEMGGGVDLLVHNASHLGPSPQPRLADYPLADFARVYEVNVTAPLALTQAALPVVRPGGRILAITSDAGVEAYEGWGGYGSSKAALEHVFAVLAAERPDLRVHRVDPGDMNTRMQQEAFPGEDVSDRAPPEDSVPGLRALIEGGLPSGRYSARALPPEPASSAVPPEPAGSALPPEPAGSAVTTAGTA